MIKKMLILLLFVSANLFSNEPQPTKADVATIESAITATVEGQTNLTGINISATGALHLLTQIEVLAKIIESINANWPQYEASIESDWAAIKEKVSNLSTISQHCLEVLKEIEKKTVMGSKYMEKLQELMPSTEISPSDKKIAVTLKEKYVKALTKMAKIKKLMGSYLDKCTTYMQNSKIHMEKTASKLAEREKVAKEKLEKFLNEPAPEIEIKK